MNAGEGGEFVDEGLLGAGYWGGRKAAAGRGGCGHLAGTQVLAECHGVFMDLSVSVAEPPNRSAKFN